MKSSVTADDIGRGLEGRRVGSRWMCKCPAHDDNKPSLSVSAGDDGRPLVHCFTGCTQDEVISSLRSRGLWPEKDREPFTPQRRMNYEQERKDKDAARVWAIAAIPLAEELLEQMDSGDAARGPITRALQASRDPSRRTSEYLAMKKVNPDLAAAMVYSGRAAERRLALAAADALFGSGNVG